MKRFLACFLTFCLLTASLPVWAETAPTPLPGYTLRASDTDIIVFATRSNKANIVGLLNSANQAEVAVLEVQGEWCYIRFPASYGTGYGYVPLSSFDVAPPATPMPDLSPSFEVGASAWILNGGPGYRVNLRESPALTAKSIGKYYTGTPLTLTGQVENGFAQVLLAGTTLGWLDVRFLTLDAGSFVPELPAITVDNKGSGANLRYGPGTGYDRLGWYAHGTQVTVLGVRADGWYHVMAAEQIGYMAESMLSGKFPYDYGTDSDDPLLHDNMADASTTLYLNTRSAGGQLHLRKAAGTGSKSLGVFYTGTPVTVVSYTRTGWAYVRIGHLEGYMDADYLTAAKPTQCGETRIVRNSQTDGLNLRSLPSTGSEVLDYLANYTRVTVLGDLRDGWCYVLYGDVYGYMLGTHLKKDK